VSLAPVIPGLTDHEIPEILRAAAEHGASWASWLLLRLPGTVEGIFTRWLAETLPERSGKVLNRLRHLRGGALNDSRFGRRMRGQGVFAEQIRGLFATACRRYDLAREGPLLSTAAFRRPGGHQLALY
jgi:DNA repair photolyase